MGSLEAHVEKMPLEVVEIAFDQLLSKLTEQKVIIEEELASFTGEESLQEFWEWVSEFLVNLQELMALYIRYFPDNRDYKMLAQLVEEFVFFQSLLHKSPKELHVHALALRVEEELLRVMDRVGLSLNDLKDS